MSEYPEMRWLTMEEAMVKFRLSEKGIRSSISSGKLQFLRVGKHSGVGQIRILDPGPKYYAYLDSLGDHLSHVPLLSTAEVAEVTGYTVLYIQQLVKQRKLKPTRGYVGWHQKGVVQQKFFTVDEVRRFLFKVEKKQRQGRRIVKIARIVRWAATLLDEERKNTTEGSRVIDEMDSELAAIIALPDPARTNSLRALWMKLEGVKLMVEAVRNPPAVLPLESQTVPDQPESSTLVNCQSEHNAQLQAES